MSKLLSITTSSKLSPSFALASFRLPSGRIKLMVTLERKLQMVNFSASSLALTRAARVRCSHQNKIAFAKIWTALWIQLRYGWKSRQGYGASGTKRGIDGSTDVILWEAARLKWWWWWWLVAAVEFQLTENRLQSCFPVMIFIIHNSDSDYSHHLWLFFRHMVLL